MNISILGAGNAGCAHAFKFSEAGHNVALIKTSDSLHEPNFKTIQSNGGIYCIDNTAGSSEKIFQPVDLITKDVKLGLTNADVVMVLTQSLQHRMIAKLLAKNISNKTKLVLIVPGNLGSLLFLKELQDLDIIIAEGESTPYDARIIEPGLVNILFKNVRNALAFLPNHKKDEGISIASQLVDTYNYTRSNVVESALHNPNLIVHTVGVIMSANRIELMKGEFWMYRESFSPAIWNLIEKLDNEKNEVIKAFGGKEASYLDSCKFRNEMDLNIDSLEVFNSYAENGGPKGPASLDTRYIYEDVTNGLCLLSLLAKKANIRTPITDSLVTIATALVNYDFKNASMSLSELGLEDLTIEEIKNLINK